MIFVCHLVRGIKRGPNKSRRDPLPAETRRPAENTTFPHLQRIPGDGRSRQKLPRYIIERGGEPTSESVFSLKALEEINDAAPFSPHGPTGAKKLPRELLPTWFRTDGKVIMHTAMRCKHRSAVTLKSRRSLASCLSRKVKRSLWLTKKVPKCPKMQVVYIESPWIRDLFHLSLSSAPHNASIL